MTQRIIVAILLSVLAVALPLSAYSQNSVEQEFKTKLQAFGNKNTTIQSDFKQNKKVKNITKIIESRGSFYYDNSGLMAMHYTEPKGDKLIMNGSSFVIVTSGKTKNIGAESNPMMTQISYMMQACMSGDISKLGQNWQLNIEKTEKGFKVLLKPTDKQLTKYITSMTMFFRASDFTLDLLRIDESAGGYTEYTFLNKKINDKIDSSYFKVN